MSILLFLLSWCKFLLSWCKFLLSWCKFLLSWCKFLLSWCKFLLSRCKFLLSWCKFLLSWCKFLLSWCKFFFNFQLSELPALSWIYPSSSDSSCIIYGLCVDMRSVIYIFYDCWIFTKLQTERCEQPCSYLILFNTGCFKIFFVFR